MGQGDNFSDATEQLLANEPSFTNLTLANRHGVPREVFDALAQNRHVKTAHFELTHWTDSDCEEFRRSGAPGSLTSLFLTRNCITSAGLRALSEVLLRGRLTSLNLGNNPLGNDLASFGRAVASSCISSLNLNETQSGEGITAFVEALRGGTSCLQVLHLQGNRIGDSVASAIAVPLAEVGVHELYLAKNQIGDIGATSFAHSMPGSSIRRMSLLHNSLGDEAAQQFAAALGANPLVEHLNLSHNRIGDAGLAALANGVQSNSRLRTLDVGVNPNTSQPSKLLLLESMSPDCQRHRRHRSFISIAHLLLVAHAQQRRLEVEPLGNLPHALMVTILQHLRTKLRC